MSHLSYETAVKITERIVQELMSRGFTTDKIDGAVGLHDTIVGIISTEQLAQLDRREQHSCCHSKKEPAATPEETLSDVVDNYFGPIY